MNSSLPKFTWKILLILFTLSSVSSVSAQRAATSSDLQFPEQNIDIIEGEVVWLQGAIFGGSPQPYRNPSGPLAAYEQGILNESGELWTILDTPQGRELRYNPELRGQRLKVRGWLHRNSKIIEVKEWRAGKHKVRIDEEYEPPQKLPFDPTKAETIESLPPLPLKHVEDSLLQGDLWLQGEGYDLGLQAPSKVESASPSAESVQLKNLLDELDKELGRRGIPPASGEEKISPSVVPPVVPKVPLPGKSAAGETPVIPPKKTQLEPAAPKPPPGPPLIDEQGHPVTRPEDFDEALRRELIQEITPQK